MTNFIIVESRHLKIHGRAKNANKTSQIQQFNHSSLYFYSEKKPVNIKMQTKGSKRKSNYLIRTKLFNQLNLQSHQDGSQIVSINKLIRNQLVLEKFASSRSVTPNGIEIRVEIRVVMETKKKSKFFINFTFNGFSPNNIPQYTAQSVTKSLSGTK